MTDIQESAKDELKRLEPTVIRYLTEFTGVPVTSERIERLEHMLQQYLLEDWRHPDEPPPKARVYFRQADKTYFAGFTRGLKH